jgi:hypothetical protein
LPESSPFTTSNFPTKVVGWLCTLWLRRASAADDGALAAGIDLEEGVLVSLSGVETSSPLRDDFHMTLTEISLLIS